MRTDAAWVVCGASIFILIGGAILIPGIRNLSRAIASARWPRTAAVVVQSDSSAETERTSSGTQTGTMYSADIRLRYQIGGREFTTDLLHFGQTGGSGDSSDAELRRLRYPVGSAVTVAYNPNAPDIAAAEPGFHSEALLLPGAGLAFLVPGIMCIVLYFGTSEGDNTWFGVGLGIFAGIFATLGLVFLTIGLVNLSRAHESQQWPRAQGVIVYGKIDSSTTVSRSSTSVSSTSYGDHLIFRYEVNGEPHFSNTRLFGQVAEASADSALIAAMRYPLGKAVTVHYSPVTADLGVLEPGIYNEAFWLPGAGAAFLLFAIAVFVWGIPALTR